MQLVEFFAQRRNQQDRLLGSLRGQLAPAPVLAAPLALKLNAPLLGAAVALLLAAVGVLIAGFGDYASTRLRLGFGATALIALLLFASGFCVAYAWAARRRIASLPYPAGVYLFGGALLDARSKTIRAYAAEDIQSAVNNGHILRVTCGATTYDFACESPIVADNWRHDFASMLASAKATPLEDRVAFDPLVAPRFDNPLAATEPLQPGWPFWMRLPWVPALGLAALLAPLLVTARNYASDGRAASRAEAIGTPAALREYIAHGSVRKLNAERELLPRAELAETEAQQNLPAMLAFASQHAASIASGSDIDREIQAAVARGYAREFELAKQAKSLRALYKFAETYPQHGLGGMYKAAVHEQFVAALARTPKGPLGLAWLPALFAYAEQSSIPFQVAVESFSTKGFAAVDLALAKVPESSGEQARPSRYFGTEAQAVRDTARADAVKKMLTRHLDPDFVHIDAAPAAPLAAGKPTRATVRMRVQSEWSGLALASRKPRAVIVGIERNVVAELVGATGEASAWKFTRKFTPNLPREGAEPLEPGIYAALNDKADTAALSDLETQLFGAAAAPEP